MTRDEMIREAEELEARADQCRDYPGTCIPLQIRARKIRDRIAEQYPPSPLEVARAEAASYELSANYRKFSAGTRALGRLAAGDDPDTVIAEMRAEWAQAAAEMVERA